jgi:UPF0755 protein
MSEHDPETVDTGPIFSGDESRAESAPARRVGHRRARRRSGCLPILVVLVVAAVGGYFAVTQGIDAIRDQFADAEDFSGPGTGSVTFEVARGDYLSTMGTNLEQQGVVASAEAFTDAASANSAATGIQAGFYELRNEMKASDVVGILVDPDNIISTAVTVPEGLTQRQIVDVLAKGTEIRAREFTQVLAAPDAIGLPAYAEGNPEGYLFPATYTFGPNATAESILTAMVTRWQQAALDADLEGAAERLGYTPHELMTIASLIEAEALPPDMPKVSRVIYNRLENPDNGQTNGKLEIDATVNYALGRDDLGVGLTAEDLQVDSPYNTRRYPGLPPGPIEAPGDAALAAAIAPAEGPWLYYATVDLETGETKFTDDFEEFQQFDAELCANSPETC